MNEVKHTPGPYRAQRQTDSKNRYVIRAPHPDYPGSPQASLCVASDVRTAGACLFAAAPDLLAALKEADAALASGQTASTLKWHVMGAREVIAAAIAKAEGTAE